MSGPVPSAARPLGRGNLWQRWVSRLAHQEPATPLALFRICVGLVVLHTTVSMVSTGVVEPILLDLEHGGYRRLHPDYWLVHALGWPDPRATWALIYGGAVASAALVVGLGGRLAALVALQCCIGLFDLHPGTGGGHDKLITNALWLLVLSPSTATLSLDARIRHGRWARNAAVAAWPRYLAIFQIGLVYGITGIQKLGAEWFPWGGYTALYYSLMLPSWARWDMSWVAWVHPLTQLGTAVTWIWEVTWPLVLLAAWYRASRDRPGRLRALSNRLDPRRFYVVTGVLMHGLVWATMNVGPFSWITLSFYVTLFHHDEYARLWRRIRRPRATPVPDAPG